MKSPVLIGVIGVLAGLLVAVALRDGLFAGSARIRDVGAQSGESSAANAELARRIDGLEVSLKDIRGLIVHSAAQAALEASSASARIPQGASAAEVAARLDALEAAIAALGTQLSSALAESQAAVTAQLKSSLAEGLIAGGSRAEPLPVSLPERPIDLVRFQALRGQELEETSAAHLLWTYEQVGEAYGRPSEVYPSPGGVGIKYRYEQPDGSEFYLWFVDGKVVKAFW
jgi:hypothetical protein